MSNPSAAPEPVALGVDVGGTKVAVAVVHGDGRLAGRTRIENRDAPDADALLARVVEAAGELGESLDAAARLVGVGVGICELVGVDGEIHSSTSIPWTRAQLAQALSPLGAVRLDADVRTAALAEARAGSGRGFSSFVHVTVGTGISCCLVRDGRPEPGARGFAQLIGSAALTVPCSDDGGLTRLSLEDVAAGPALVRRFNARASEPVSRAEDVIARAAGGDAAAAGVVDEAATTLGSFVALLVNVIDPEAVVIGGGLGSAGGAYWDATLGSARAHIWAEPARELPIVPAALGSDAGVVGAGLLALDGSAPLARVTVGEAS